MREEARNSICPECGSYRVTYEHTDNYDWQLCTCGRCGCSGTPDEFFHNSVFARITASPELLAESSVYFAEEYTLALEGSEYGVTFPGGWTSPFIEYTYGTKPEAVAATIEKLKEAKND